MIKPLKNLPGVIAYILAATACIPDLTTIEGRHIIYEHPPTRTPCSGTTKSLNDFVDFLAGALEIRVSSSFRYSWLDSATSELVGAYCPVSDCVIGRHAVDYYPALKHEVVHLVMKDVAENSLPFLEEGIAGAYDPLVDGRGSPYPDPARLGDPRATLAASSPLDVDYATAAGFVAFLLTRHGAEKFAELYFRLRVQSSTSAIRGAFQDVYGVDLDHEADMYMSGAACRPDYHEVRAFECEGPVQLWSGALWTQRSALDCADDDVVGGVGDSQWRSHRSITLDVPAEGAYTIAFTGEDGLEMRLGRCFGCVWDRDDVFLGPGGAQVKQLNPGRHFVRVTGDSERASLYEITVTPMDE